MKMFYLIFFLIISKNYIFCLNIVENKVISVSEKVGGIISNYFTHETFLTYTQDNTNIYESSIFFIVRESGVNSIYFLSNGVNYENVITIANLYSVSSDYIYIPKYLIFDSNNIGRFHIFWILYSKLFYFCL